jgi:phosphonate transport system substrate-binding protein
MPRCSLKKLTVLLIVAAYFGSFSSAFAESPHKYIKIAVLPCSNIEVTFKKFYPLITYLKNKTGMDVRLLVPANFEEFRSGLENGEIDFALQDPHILFKLIDLFNRDEILRTLTMEGGTTQTGVVIVSKDSKIKKLGDLKGKTVMFGAESSTTKWVAAKILFEKNGINIDTDLKAYSHGGCCEDIAFSVYLKSVDAGVVCDHFLDEHAEKQKDLGVKASQLVAIARTVPVPTRIFAARKGVAQDIIAAMNQALLSLHQQNPEEARILNRGEMGGFQRARVEDYERMRVLMHGSNRD